MTQAVRVAEDWLLPPDATIRTCVVLFTMRRIEPHDLIKRLQASQLRKRHVELKSYGVGRPGAIFEALSNCLSFFSISTRIPAAAPSSGFGFDANARRAVEMAASTSPTAK